MKHPEASFESVASNWDYWGEVVAQNWFKRSLVWSFTDMFDNLFSKIVETIQGRKLNGEIRYM